MMTLDTFSKIIEGRQIRKTVPQYSDTIDVQIYNEY